MCIRDRSTGLSSGGKKKMSEVLSFKDIYLSDKGSGLLGILKLAPHGISWKSSSEGGKSVSVTSEELSSVHWLRVGVRFQLKVILKGGSHVKFSGLKQNDKENLENFFKKHFNLSLKTIDVSCSGENFGEATFEGNILSYKINGKLAFEIPMTDVSQSVNQKNEVMMEFFQDDTQAEECSLLEMRLVIPTIGTHAEDEPTAAEKFHKQVIQKADIQNTTGKGIALLSNLPVLNPRGRYDVEMFHQFMKLHGKTYDYKISYTSITKIYQLLKPDNRHIFFIISLDPSIRQGQTVYTHLVMQFPVEDSLTVPINLLDEEIESKYKGKLKNPMTGTTYEVVSKLFQVLTGKKLTISGSFRSHSSANAIKCSLKANDGYLFPLERSFFFVHKPPTHIYFDNIGEIEFSRMSTNTATNRNFDLIIHLKNGNNVQFTNIQRQEYQNLLQFLLVKELPVKKSKEKGFSTGGALAAAADLAADEASAESERENEVIKKSSTGDDDEDSEEDEDFAPVDEDDVPEEYDENYSSEGEPGEDQEAENGQTNEKNGEKKSEKGSKEKKKEGASVKERERDKDKEGRGDKEKSNGKEKGKKNEKEKSKTKEKEKPVEKEKEKKSSSGDKSKKPSTTEDKGKGKKKMTKRKRKRRRKERKT
eukprot:TRINITY_DN263_c0_g2_i1.p1 TRINITY_DN263_c0_g2~~TRINITY_DN263_c0_g2_i1.p1  ORF type:complete len:647 (-),score=230.38 TRINITY_DN263_c0_g2_i1:220-2160(-)